MTDLTPADLSPLQRTYLGVLALGLVSAEQAHESRFRMEYLCARTHAMALTADEGAYLGAEEHTASAAFRDDLRAALIDLDRKRVIGIGPPQDVVILKPAAQALDDVYGHVDVNKHPPIFDRFLAQQCMDSLLSQPPIYRYLMDLYADSGEIWHELSKQGYGQYR